VKKLRVGILFGGRSTEHEVSIVSARNVLAALDPERFQAVPIGIDKSGRFRPLSPKALLESENPLLAAAAGAGSLELGLLPLRRGTLEPPSSEDDAPLDVVFPVLHGPLGEDGTVQGLLELMDLPCVGSGVLGSAIGMDKDVAKRLLRDAGIPVVPFVSVRRVDFERSPSSVAERAAALGLPLFTKPANAGSSVGVRKVKALRELAAALRHAFEFDTKALVEASVEGVREIECAVLGNHEPEASVVGEIVVVHRDGFYSYEAKYQDETGALLEIPAKLEPELADRVRALSIETFRVLELSGLARVDFFLGQDGALFVNEVNTLPGFTALSMYPKLWEASGLSPQALMTRLIELAIARKAEQRALTRDFDSAESR
jgi:D-alanine-D-alanine ligase